MIESATSVAKDLLSPVLDPVLSLAQEVLPLVEDVATAVLPETQELFNAASSLLGGASTQRSPSDPRPHEGLERIQKLPQLSGRGKQVSMLRILELLLSEIGL